jgi:uncharacterized protein YyaL (SSP411 family)
MCVSAYLDAAKVLNLAEARQFALRSLDRLLSEGWDAERGMRHVIAYSDPKAARRDISGVLDDYAFTVLACLDAYEATADLSYFRFARSIGDAMVAGFFDPAAGGFFDTRVAAEGFSGAAVSEKIELGILGMRRKPFQDSPTPAGNPAAAIALLRLHGYAEASPNPAFYRDKAEQTLEAYAGVAGQHGIFAATYGLAVAHLVRPHALVVIIGKDEVAAELYRTAVGPLAWGTAVLRLDADKAVAQNLPAALAETIPNLPALRGEQSFAVVCSEFACQPPIFDAQELTHAMGSRARPAA